MTINDTVSAAVESELRRQGLSRAALAGRCMVSPQWVTYKLKGQRRWSVDDVELVASALGIPVAWLVLPREMVGHATSQYRRARLIVTNKYQALATLVTHTPAVPA